jgi:phytanoyl-CoA dioxygenase PhyH
MISGADMRPIAPLTEALPVTTTDILHAASDLRRFGYCMIKDAMTPAFTDLVRKRLADQAEAEREQGIGTFDGGVNSPNQRLWNLLNKGQVFHDLLLNPLVEAVAAPFVGENFVLGAYSANIAGPGGQPQVLHFDQQIYQPTLPFQAAINFAWLLDDVTEKNGGTRIAPGSHLWPHGPTDPFSLDGTIAIEAPKGTLVAWDSRTWHGTGANSATTKRHVILALFCRYYLRTNENYFLSLAPDVEAGLSEEVRALLGYRVTGRLGHVERAGDVEGKIVSRPAHYVREMCTASA